MESPKLKPKPYTKIVPVRGNLLAQLKKEILKKDLQNTEDNAKVKDNNNLELPEVKQPLKSPENKIIIQKVENIKVDIINSKGTPRRVSSLFAMTQSENQPKSVVHEVPSQISITKGIDEISSQIATDPEPLSSSTMKLLTAKVPENNFNQVVPLKVIRKIKQPTVRPIPQRFHNVVLLEPQKSPVKSASPVKTSVVSQTPTFNFQRRPLVLEPKKQVPPQPVSKIEDFFHGFSQKDLKPVELGLWKKILITNPTEIKTTQVQVSIVQETPKLSFVVKVPLQKNNKLLDKKPKKTQILEKKEPVKALVPTPDKPKASKKKTKEVASKPTPVKIPMTKIQEKLRSKPSEAIKDGKLDKLITKCVPSTSSQLPVKPQIKPPPKIDSQIPSTSKAAQNQQEEAFDESWQEDISILIGEARLAQIDESLKNIPNIVTGNPIETENVELKLIIKHLLKFSGAESILETLSIAGFEGFSKVDSEEETDFDDDFPGSFDDSSNDQNIIFNSTKIDKNQQDQKKSDNDNLPGTSRAFQVFNAKIAPTTSVQTIQDKIDQTQQKEIIKPEDEKVSPVETILKSDVISVQQEKVVESAAPDLSSVEKSSEIPEEINKQMEKSDRKRKQEEKLVLQEPNVKKAKQSKSPRNLFLDGESRRESLRSSSRESSLEPCSSKKPATKSNLVKNVSAIPELDEKEEEVKVLKVRKSRERSIHESSRDSSLDPPDSVRSTRSSRSRKDSSPVKSNDSTVESSPKKPKALSSKKSLRRQALSFSHDSGSEPSSFSVTKQKSDSDSSAGIIARSRRSTRATLPVTSESEQEKDSDKPQSKIEKPKKESAKKSAKNLRKLADDSTEDSDKPLRKLRKTKSDRGSKKQKTSKSSKKGNNETSTDTEHDDNPPASRNFELESRLTTLDSNSNHKSSIQIRNNYLKSPDKKSKEISAKFGKLSSKLRKNQLSDPTYVEPPTTEKRPRLRTSAFKGMDDSDSDADTPDEPSTSMVSASKTRKPGRQDSSDAETASRSPSPAQLGAKVVTKSKRNKSSFDLSQVEKKIFAQEKLEPSNDKLVPYDEIVQVIKMSKQARKIGRSSNKLKQEEQQELDSILASLKKQEYFMCGSCNFKVTKHKWIEHFVDHGGYAWIDKLETPLDLDDWNELIRRGINTMKIYKLSKLKCPNCDCERVSAFGHLSHFILCGESPEVVESRKISCSLCDEKFLPFNTSSHRSKCSALKVPIVEEPKKIVKSSNESEGDEDQVGLSGRRKRRAVKKAERSFKQIIDNLNADSDYIAVFKGRIECCICRRSDFKTQEEALKHVKNEHGHSENGLDFEGSDTDASVKEFDESSEDEGSSGDESSEIASDSDEMGSDNDQSSFVKAKEKSYESQEFKNAKALVSQFDVQKYNRPRLAELTKEFFKKLRESDSLSKMEPILLSALSNVKSTLISFKFNTKSPKFANQPANNYRVNFDEKIYVDWKQLEIGDQTSEKETETIYCGGSVASLDWAPGNYEFEYLAVACNPGDQGIQMELERTSKSCVQIYELSGLSNHSFDGFDNPSKLKYVIIVNDGPVLCIKFHPSANIKEHRIGLLAVSTANQNVLIYALPHRNEENAAVLSLQPNLYCRLSASDLLFNEKFLFQTTKVTWYVKQSGETLLAAGYINGLVAIWNIDEDSTKTSYPIHVIQAHLEPITAIDFKSTESEEFHLLTASLDRKLKVFTFNDLEYQESSCHYSVSRVLCAEWWLNWPAYLIGYDECFCSSIFHCRQPMEFGAKNNTLFSSGTGSIRAIGINNILNVAMFATDSGDIFGCNPEQLMMPVQPKTKWSYYNFMIHSFTDYNKIVEDDEEEVGVVFCDTKNGTKEPKKLRSAPTDRINELLINQICFSRNAKTHRFYALGYETGFVRIKYLKKAK